MNETDQLVAERDQRSASLSVGIVTYKPQWPVLEATLKSLKASLDHAAINADVVLVDNSPVDDVSTWIRSSMPDFQMTVISGHGNVGFGRANNLTPKWNSPLHLVLNPDVEMDSAALQHAINFMMSNPACGLLTPAAFSPDGSRQYLCKRYPAIFDLFLRGFAPAFIRQFFAKRLDCYEMRDQIGEQPVWDPPIVSGCFMLFRGDVFRALKGFDPRYMLYFEDFDISLRASLITRIAYVPSVRIVHGGGNAGRKGAWHIWQFVRSAAKFYSTHGLKIF
ncbi:glycosyltransferase [Rhizobium sp. IBUN]|uniref:glycosyltransferase n=1 Tax=Rhizobium sp. IBUN TaxID=1042326 RepID=UPI00046ED891|nr:glycosyltransferase [Rhizobium sp. IBUN]